jgi:hypothetical protein
MKKVIIVNLFGGPGTGKSTTAAGVFAKLKMQNINCELVQEFAKHVVWRENYTTLNNQLYIFAKQHDRLFHLKDKVDIIITDSPTIMGLTYTDFSIVSPSLETLVVDEYTREDQRNLNVFINRVTDYDPVGRTQNEGEAKQKDVEIHNLLNKYNLPYITLDADDHISDTLSEIIIKILEEEKKN